jgi:hypothetical protein
LAAASSRTWRVQAIEVLRAIKEVGGDQAFDRAARDLFVSISAILAREHGRKYVAKPFDVVERVLPEQRRSNNECAPEADEPARGTFIDPT